MPERPRTPPEVYGRQQEEQQDEGEDQQQQDQQDDMVDLNLDD